MRVGQIFDLPPDILYSLGHIGKLKNEDETKLMGKYIVGAICSCGELLPSQNDIDKHLKLGHLVFDGELKGRVIVTYGNKRRINERIQ